MIRILPLLLITLFTLGCETSSRHENEMLYKCIGLNSCAQSMMLRVREKAKWICDKKSNDKVVIISSKLSDLGEIIDINVKSSSDDKEFDLAAIQAVKNSAPFRELGSLSDEELIKAKSINFKFVGNKD